MKLVLMTQNKTNIHHHHDDDNDLHTLNGCQDMYVYWRDESNNKYYRSKKYKEFTNNFKKLKIKVLLI